MLTIISGKRLRCQFSTHPALVSKKKLKRFFDSSGIGGSKQVSGFIEPTQGIDFDAIRDLLKSKSPGSREEFIQSHVDILKYLEETGQASMNDLAEKLQQRQNYIHVRLKNLMDLGILRREKQPRGVGPSGRRITEFVYSISISPEKFSPAEQIGLDSTNKDALIMSQEHLSFDQSSPSPKAVPTMPNLPDYDPSWPEEIKAEWFRLYRQLLEIQKTNL